MKRVALTAITALLAGVVSADCPVTPISCGFHGSGTFSPTCTGDFTLGDSTVTYPEQVFSISPPVGEALGATVTVSAFGSVIFIVDPQGNTLDSSLDVYEVLNTLSVGIKIPASGTYSIVIATPDASGSATYDLDVTCAGIPPLADHTMTKEVNSSVDPVGRTTTFGSADDGAWSWVELNPMTGIHHVIWSFVEPGGTPYDSTDIGVGINDTKSYIGKAAGGMFLIHQPAGLLPGPWTVNVTLDGTPLVTEHFTLVLQSMRPRVGGIRISPIGLENGR